MAAEKALKAYIQENTHDVFGEEIRWVGKNLPGEGSRLSPDFIGYDVNGNLVIVEVKIVYPRTSSPRNQYARARESVGQILHYAAACAEEGLNAEHLCDFGEEAVRDAVKNVRFFIVTETLHYALEKMCHFLSAYGLNICYIAVDCV